MKYDKPPVDEAIFEARVRTSEKITEPDFQAFLRDSAGYESDGKMYHVEINADTAQQQHRQWVIRANWLRRGALFFW